MPYADTVLTRGKAEDKAEGIPLMALEMLRGGADETSVARVTGLSMKQIREQQSASSHQPCRACTHRAKAPSIRSRAS